MTDTSLISLHNILFEQVDRLNDVTLDEDALEREIKRADAMEGIAKAITTNAGVMLKAVSTAGAPSGLVPLADRAQRKLS